MSFVYAGVGTLALLTPMVQLPSLLMCSRAEASMAEVGVLRLVEKLGEIGGTELVAWLPDFVNEPLAIYSAGGALDLFARSAAIHLSLYWVVATALAPWRTSRAPTPRRRTRDALVIGAFAAPLCLVVIPTLAPEWSMSASLAMGLALAAIVELACLAVLPRWAAGSRGAAAWALGVALVPLGAMIGTLVFPPPFAVGIQSGPRCPSRPVRGQPPPSIVLLVVDTLRADFLGTSGFPEDISPHVDRVAKEAIRFTQAISAAPWTKPAMASLMTSLYPWQHRVVDHPRLRGPGRIAIDTLSEDLQTLPEALCDAGYHTAAFVANDWLESEFGFAQGFEDYVDGYAEVTAAERVLRDVERWLEERGGDAPFFLYVHLVDPHGPYESSQADYERMRAAAAVGSTNESGCAELPEYLLRGVDHIERGRRRDPAALRAQYAASIRTFDRQVGGFLSRFAAGGELDSSWLVVTSDHGEEFCEHGGWGHGRTLFDHQVRVPLLIRPPGGVPGGRAVNAVVGLVDLMPTLLDIARASRPDGLEGRALSQLLAGESDEAPSLVYMASAFREPELYGIRSDRYKLLYRRTTGEARLYDLAVDPLEQTDVASEHPDRVRALVGAFESKLRSQTIEFQPGRATLSPRAESQLRALGYLE